MRDLFDCEMCGAHQIGRMKQFRIGSEDIRFTMWFSFVGTEMATMGDKMFALEYCSRTVYLIQQLSTKPYHTIPSSEPQPLDLRRD